MVGDTVLTYVRPAFVNRCVWEAEGGADARASGRATAPPSSPRRLAATTPAPPRGGDSRGPLPGAGARTDGRRTRRRSLIASRLRGHVRPLRRIWPFAQKRDARSPAACAMACAEIQKVISSFEFENSILSTRICKEFRFFDPRLTSLVSNTNAMQGILGSAARPHPPGRATAESCHCCRAWAHHCLTVISFFRIYCLF